jgi:ribosomal protein L37AE/L43A
MNLKTSLNVRCISCGSNNNRLIYRQEYDLWLCQQCIDKLPTSGKRFAKIKGKLLMRKYRWRDIKKWVKAEGL